MRLGESVTYPLEHSGVGAAKWGEGRGEVLRHSCFARNHTASRLVRNQGPCQDAPKTPRNLKSIGNMNRLRRTRSVLECVQPSGALGWRLERMPATFPGSRLNNSYHSYGSRLTVLSMATTIVSPSGEPKKDCGLAAGVEGLRIHRNIFTQNSLYGVNTPWRPPNFPAIVE